MCAPLVFRTGGDETHKLSFEMCTHTHTHPTLTVLHAKDFVSSHTGTQTYTLLKMIDNSESSTAVVVKENLLCSGFQSLGSYGKMSCTYLSHATANVHTYTWIIYANSSTEFSCSFHASAP